MMKQLAPQSANMVDVAKRLLKEPHWLLSYALAILDFVQCVGFGFLSASYHRICIGGPLLCALYRRVTSNCTFCHKVRIVCLLVDGFRDLVRKSNPHKQQRSKEDS